MLTRIQNATCNTKFWGKFTGKNFASVLLLKFFWKCSTSLLSLRYIFHGKYRISSATLTHPDTLRYNRLSTISNERPLDSYVQHYVKHFSFFCAESSVFIDLEVFLKASINNPVHCKNLLSLSLVLRVR